MDRISQKNNIVEGLLGASSSNISDTLVLESDLPWRLRVPDYCHHLEKQRRFGVDATNSDVVPSFRRVETAFSPEIPSDEDRAISSWKQANQLLLLACYSAQEDSDAAGATDADQAWPRLLTIVAVSDQRRDHVRDTFDGYRSRVEKLLGEAALDGIAPNKASERDFWSFMRSIPSARQAGIVLLDSGNVRAVWRDGLSILVGLQFLGMGWIEYVILKRRVGSARVSQTSGVDTVDVVKRQLRAFELTSWLTPQWLRGSAT